MDKGSFRKMNLKSIIRQRMRNAGIWNDSSTYGIHWAAKMSILAFFLTLITQALALFMTRGDSKELLSCFSVLSFCFMGFLKLISLVTGHTRWRLLISLASSLEQEQINERDYKYDYESDGEEDDSFSEHIRSYTKKFSTISIYLSRVYCFTAVVFMASPFIEYGLHLYQGTYVERYPHILPSWNPLDFSTTGYVVTILAEILSAVYCVRVHTAFDLTAIGLMIFIRGQFNLLHRYSERIGGHGNNCYLSNRRDARAHLRIKKCHHIHVTLLKSVNQLVKLIKNILGIYFFLATLTLCSVAVQLKSEQLSAAQVISLLQYMGATLMQLFLFCQYGDAVFAESSVGLGEGPLCSACWCLSSRIRREIAILSVGMARPCRMLAGPFNSLDLPSFIQIVRAAYSYYAVLRQTPK
ncbi:uncharacterized protein LOC120627398 [Pararge aegeria]|uniref:uncharacterized protein LOC120627398 n=1 Tax=Pararge aegeria TaxID=116150 RepID=UPI0019D0A052|nr:uncharacterized protein LOC120627398 [Pararge aegeria]